MESTLVCEPLAVARVYPINNVRKNNMVTHAKLAAQMLREAAIFFRSVADDNPSLAEEMMENASVYDEVAALVESDPLGEIGPEEDPSRP
jgi:hypothetical protein